MILLVKEEIIEGDLICDIFSSPLLNKSYNKTLKILLITLIYIRFVVSDFAYDSGIRTHLKKLIFSLSETYVNIGEMFIIQKLDDGKGVKKEINEKFIKSCKSHKINKNLKTNDLIFFMNKNNENTITAINQFSTYHYYLILGVFSKLFFFIRYIIFALIFLKTLGNTILNHYRA